MFRVGAEQLRSRGGMVRCGSCRRVFNAISGLDYLDAQRLGVDGAEAPRTAAAALPPTTAPAASRNATQAVPPVAPGPAAAPAAGSGPAAQPVPAGTAARAGGADAPSRQVALTPSDSTLLAKDLRAGASSWVDMAALSLARANPPAQSPDVPQAADDSEAGAGPATLFEISRPAREAGDARDDSSAEENRDEPSFLRARDAAPTRAARIGLALGSVLLVAALATELALIFRSPLIVALPGLRPALQALCLPLACSASWPMRPDLLAVVSSELESVPGTDAFELDTVLRNRADFALALPAIELTISDDIGHAVARKVFLPADYTAGAGRLDPAAANIGPGADLAVHIRFAFAGGAASGFEAYPFYP